MKRRVPLGRIKTPTGYVDVKNAAVARTLEELQAGATHNRDGWQRESVAHQATRDRLTRLRGHWWTRVGEALRIIRP